MIRGVGSALDAAVAAGRTERVVFGATDDRGALHLSAHGDARTDSIFRLFSMTKLVGALGAMMLIDRGALAPDQPVGDFAPEFDALPVLDGFDGDEPRLRPQRSRATIGDLMAHRSGCVYGEWHAPMRRWLRHAGIRQIDDASVAGLSAIPLAFDPGTAWGYGTGVDWLGVVIQRATGERLEDWIPREIFAPCGADDLFFDLTEAQSRRLVPARMFRDGAFAPLAMQRGGKPEHYPMGAALFGTVPAFLNLLAAILRGEFLSPGAREAFFAGRTADIPFGPMPTANPGASADVDFFPGVPKSFAYAGLRVDADVPGARRAGSVSWAGMQNTHFWIDPASGLAAVLAMQHLPFVDANAMAVYDMAERAVYAGR